MGSYKEIIVAMGRTGLVGYGGGPSIIPLIRHEAVTRYSWINDDEFGEILALANTLPGPIATKMAAYLGYRTKGALGAVVAVLSHILPTVLAMVFLLGIMLRFQKSPIVHGMIAAVDPVIVVLLGLMAYDFSAKAVKGLGIWLSLLFGVGAFALLEVAHAPTGLVVIGFLVYGAMHLPIVRRIRKRSDKERNGGVSQ